jgi:hypothetical protein
MGVATFTHDLGNGMRLTSSYAPTTFLLDS